MFNVSNKTLRGHDEKFDGCSSEVLQELQEAESDSDADD